MDSIQWGNVFLLWVKSTIYVFINVINATSIWKALKLRPFRPTLLWSLSVLVTKLYNFAFRTNSLSAILELYFSKSRLFCLASKIFHLTFLLYGQILEFVPHSVHDIFSEPFQCHMWVSWTSLLPTTHMTYFRNLFFLRSVSLLRNKIFIEPLKKKHFFRSHNFNYLSVYSSRVTFNRIILSTDALPFFRIFGISSHHKGDPFTLVDRYYLKPS